MRASSVRILVPTVVLLLAGALASPSRNASAFAPAAWMATLAAPGSASHPGLTADAISALVAETFTTNEKADYAAVDEIIRANHDVDDDQKTSAKHVDGESFTAAQERVLRMLRAVVDASAAGDMHAARRELGGALHTVQDFYSHSNWIELGQTAPHPNFANPADPVIPNVAAPDEPTCNNADTLITTKLTSGYYYGEDSPPNGEPIPGFKCRHGGVTEIIGDAQYRGINKDNLNALVSPHQEFHNQAADVAEAATLDYLRRVRGEITIEQLRALFGVGPSLSVAVDTTFSMDDVIDAVKSQVVGMIEERANTPHAPNHFVVAGFNDPDVGPLWSTSSPGAIEFLIDQLEANAGGDCPELAMEGTLLTAMAASQGGDLFVFTDADAKDAHLAFGAVSVAKSEKIRVHPIVFGECSEGDSAYADLAEESGGMAFVVDRFEVEVIAPLMDLLSRPEQVDILKASAALTGQRDLTFPVDSSVEQLVVMVSGDADVTLTRPDDEVLTSDGAAIPLNHGVVFVETSPIEGAWGLHLEGNGPVSVRVAAQSPLRFGSFDFVRLIDDGHKHFKPIPGDPPTDAGSSGPGMLAAPPRVSPPHAVAAADAHAEAEPEGELMAYARVAGDFEDATVELRDLDGNVLAQLTLDRGTTPADNEFVGDVVVPSVPFRAYVTGHAAGAVFQRMVPRVFRPQPVLVTPPSVEELRPGTSTTYDFEVTNVGAPDTFELRADDDRGLVSVPPTTVSLATGESASLAVELDVPAEARPGLSETVVVTARSARNPDARNAAVLSSPIISGEVATGRTTPSTLATVVPIPNAHGWTRGAVALELNAVPAPARPAVKELHVSATGAEPRSLETFPGASTLVPVYAEGVTTFSFAAEDESGGSEATRTLDIRIDNGAPTATIESGLLGFPPVFIAPLLPVELRASAGDVPLADGSDPSGVEALCFTVTRVDLLTTSPAGCFDAQLDGQAWVARPDLATGLYDVEARVTDRAGNSSTSVVQTILVLRLL